VRGAHYGSYQCHSVTPATVSVHPGGLVAAAVDLQQYGTCARTLEDLSQLGSTARVAQPARCQLGRTDCGGCRWGVLI